MRARNPLITISAASAAVVLLGLTPASARTAAPAARREAPAVAARPCALSANPYSVPRSVLRACGYRFIARAGTMTLPGGGRSYLYRVGGHTATYSVPPKGFDVLAATNSQLREFNIPLRSQLGGAARWSRIMRRVRFAAPPATLIEGPQKFTPRCGSNACWAGYVDTGHSNYTSAAANWKEPKISSSACSGPSAEGTWVGIGGYTSSDLGQDGTAYGTGHPHGAWWEVLPADPVYSSWDASVGQTVSTNTSRVDGKYSFVVIAGSHILNPSYQGGGYSGSSAEFITELPAGFDLENFGTIPFTDAYAGYGGGGGHGVGQLPHTKIIAKNSNNGNQEMMQPGAISGADDQNFTMTENHCD